MRSEASRKAARSFLMITLLLAGACGDDLVGLEGTDFAPSLGVDLDQMTRLPSGVYIQTLQVGFGSTMVEPNDSIEVAYTLWIPNGTEIDSGELSRNVTSLIPGFQDGVEGMVTGETRLMVIPSNRGYGATPPSGSGIPPHSVLVFRVELLSIPSN